MIFWHHWLRQTSTQERYLRLPPHNFPFLFSMSVPPTKRYQYEPLPTGDYIRLLHLYPSPYGVPLTARLEVISISDAPTYECLSYVWGSDVREYSLEIMTDSPEESNDLGTIPITRSLFDALSDLRPLPENGGLPRALWADAVCINQQNIVEKNIQVPLMGQIYQNAKTVVAYLCSDPTGSIFSNFLLSMEEIQAKANDRSWLDTNFKKAMYWVTRTLIVQEAILARHLVFSIGRKVLEAKHYWSRMSEIVDYYNQNSRLSPLLTLHENAERHRERGRVMTSGTPFIVLMIVTRGTACKDPRDKVFAMLNLSVQARRLSIIADYDRSVADIYTDMAHHFLTTEAGIHACGLHLLVHAYQRKIHGLPSYVPDWSIQDRCQPEIGIFDGMVPMQIGPVPQRYQKGILLECLSFGRLTEVKAFPQSLDDIDSIETWRSIAEFVKDFLDRCQPQGQPFEELADIALCSLGRALIGCDLDEATDEAWDEYLNWLRGVETDNQKDDEQQRLARELFIRYSMELREHASLPWASKMWISDTGFIGNGCEGAQVGDQIVIPFGGESPLLIRPRLKSNKDKEQGHGNDHEKLNVFLSPRSTQLIPAQIQLTSEQKRQWLEQREREQEETAQDDKEEERRRRRRR
ncbi:heterokaryon incompatibility protein-domain-containing protein [Pestalotiopsis sp. NC0098]|nr:heterokaryon incompatibility protein-domain-containing protein [Pestalotiopsis sp. NC0098]